MAYKIFWVNSLTGGGVNSLDAIDPLDTLGDGTLVALAGNEAAIHITNTSADFYYVDASNSEPENAPDLIVPDLNPGTFRWVRVPISKADLVALGLDLVNNTADLDKPISTATQTALNLKADLVGGLVPSNQLPSYVDDVLEYANFASFPATGETGKIYIDIATNEIYRWSGTVYVKISDVPTAADIKTLYESNADTNAFTDALLTSLTSLSDNSIANTLHRHSELVASDGSPDPALSIDAVGDISTSGMLELSALGTGNRYAYIDFHGDDINTGYALRLIRHNTGENANSEMRHRGTGDLNFITESTGNFNFYTNSLLRATITGTTGLFTISYGMECNAFTTYNGQISLKDQGIAGEGGHITFTGEGLNDYYNLDNYLGDCRLWWNDTSDHSFDISNAGAGSASMSINGGQAIDEFSTDGTFTGASNNELKTGLAIKTYVDARANTSLVDNSIADTLHRHSELVASDGSPDPILSVGADGTVKHFTAESGYTFHYYHCNDDSALATTVIAHKSRGTYVLPTAALNGDSGYAIQCRWYDGTSYPYSMTAMIIQTTEDHTPTNKGCKIRFSTTANGSATSVARLTIDHNGYVAIGSHIPTQALDVSGNVTATGTFTGTSFNSITGLASATPLMDGTGAVGTSTLTARQDHVHPSDTAKLDAVGGTIAGYVEATETALLTALSFTKNFHVRTLTAPITFTLADIPASGSSRIELWVIGGGTHAVTLPAGTWLTPTPTWGSKNIVLITKVHGDATIYYSDGGSVA